MAQRDRRSAAAEPWSEQQPWPGGGPSRRVSPGERLLLLALAGLVALAGLIILAAPALGTARLVLGVPIGVTGVGLFVLALRNPAPVGDGDLSALAVLRIERWALTPPALAALVGAALLALDRSLHVMARLSVGLGSLVLFMAFGLLVTRARPETVARSADLTADPEANRSNGTHGSDGSEHPPAPPFAPRPPSRFDAS